MEQLRDPTTQEDASGEGQDHRLHGFSGVPVPPPFFYTNLCRTCSDFVNSPGLDQSKPSTSHNLPHSPSQATGINPNISPLSPSPAKGGFTELPPRAALRRCLSDVLPVPVASPPTTGQGEQYRSLHKRDLTASEDASGDGQPQLKKRDISAQDYRLHGFSRVPIPPPSSYSSLCRSCSDFINSPVLEQSKPSPHSPQAAGINLNVSTLSPSTAKGYSTQWPSLPVQRSVSDLLPVASPPRTGVISGTYGDVPMGSPAITQESLDHERFKRMVERIKAMKLWWETVVLEAEGAELQHNNTTEESNGDTEEEVSIERDGEYLRTNMKCACGRAYQFLFSGSDCYYKIM